MRFIGITGGVGAGKSEILRYINKHYKCEIYLADEVAHLVKQPGTKAYEALLELLGRDVAGSGGHIDKALMADRIFADPSLLEQVNGIIHPAVKDFLLERLEAAREAAETELFFVEAALLIEGDILLWWTKCGIFMRMRPFAGSVWDEPEGTVRRRYPGSCPVSCRRNVFGRAATS